MDSRMRRINGKPLMAGMSDFDHLDIDGRLLNLLVAVIEEGSITRAAARLEVTQSAVSHLLDKLRGIVGDPLFVKSGRGIAPTARAEALAVQARHLLADLRQFSSHDEFDPATLSTTITIAANELQRDLLLPLLFARLRSRAPGIRLRVIPSGVPSLALLRDEGCQLAIWPRLPDGSDILCKRLFEDRYRVFYDAAARAAPDALEDYLAAEHVTVMHEQRRAVDIDETLSTRGVERRIVATVPGFSGLPPFLRGTPFIATASGLLRANLLRDLASCTVPLETPVMPMYMIWHLRHRHDPVQRWVRAELEAVVAPAIRRAGASAAA
jgi:DNA-binding transcriptional LysR family regulator